MQIDTHCHVDQYPNPIQLVHECEKNKILTVGVTNLPSHYLIGKEHVADSDFFKLAIGFHPLAVEQKNFRKELEIFKQHVLQCDYIGEIGLDFSKKNTNNHESQKDVFRQVLHSIGENVKFVSIHSRGAEKDVLELLIENKIRPVVLHWYTGASTLIEYFIANGHFFSVNPSMIQTEKGKMLISKVPRHRILTETDGPYVKIEGRQISPKDVSLVIKNLAMVWRTSEKEAQKQVQDNFDKLINLIN